MKFLFVGMLIILNNVCFAQNSIIFENSNGNQSATFPQITRFYTDLAAKNPSVHIKNFDTTDAGYPLQLVIYDPSQSFNPQQAHKENHVVLLINNGIHPGEPDGIDASMLFLHDLVSHKISLPPNVFIAVIPVYNIGGCLNRNSFSRVNQNGPESYGFRGNAQNLDLNRDFIKSDSKNAIAFAKLFQWLNPDIFIDNHVSDGADYQHTITMLTTQYNKLGSYTGDFLHRVFEPALFKSMGEKNWPMCPYVNFESSSPDVGWEAFYDSPRYSTGYAALFQTIAFMPETHMLKPFADRVHSTYAFMQTVMEQASHYAADILKYRKQSIEAYKQQTSFPVSWKADSSYHDLISFKGYAASTKTSDVTGMPRLFYDHSKPYEKQVVFYDVFKPAVTVQKPRAYIIPQGWHNVTDLLKINGVVMQRLKHDTTIYLHYYHIDDYASYPKPFEKHHINYKVSVSDMQDSIHFLKGDYIIYTGQRNDMFLVETLEPEADDSYFRWNFFDAVLQQKEGYSDYRWEDVAAAYLTKHPELRAALEERKKTDTTFAASSSAQLNFVYKHSPYYEPAHLRYPVYRLMQ